MIHHFLLNAEADRMCVSPFALRVRRQILLAGLLWTGIPSLTEAAPLDTASVVDGYVAAWNAHDPAAAVAALAADAVYYNSGAGMERDARTAIGGTLRGLLELLPDLRWQVIGQPIENASGMAFEWEVSGAYKAEGRAAPKALRIRGASLFRVQRGRISYLADYYDGESMRRQIER